MREAARINVTLSPFVERGLAMVLEGRKLLARAYFQHRIAGDLKTAFEIGAATKLIEAAMNTLKKSADRG